MSTVYLNCSIYPLFNSYYTEEADFDGTVIEITYPADEGLAQPITNVRASIPVVDDTVDEAEVQQFIAYLEIANATNLGGVDNSVRNTTICRIEDDDCKYCIIIFRKCRNNFLIVGGNALFYV